MTGVSEVSSTSELNNGLVLFSPVVYLSFPFQTYIDGPNEMLRGVVEPAGFSGPPESFRRPLQV